MLPLRILLDAARGGQAVSAAQFVQALTDPLDFLHRILYLGDDNPPSGCYTVR